MEAQKQAGQILSYAYGIMIAAAVVLCLILIFYFTSDGFAAQREKTQSVAQQTELKTKSVAELVEIVHPLSRGRRPRQGPDQDRVLAAILQLGEAENDLAERIKGIAIAGNVSDSEYESAARIAIGACVGTFFSNSIQESPASSCFPASSSFVIRSNSSR